jgi:hypothetical protein
MLDGRLTWSEDLIHADPIISLPDGERDHKRAEAIAKRLCDVQAVVVRVEWSYVRQRPFRPWAHHSKRDHISIRLEADALQQDALSQWRGPSEYRELEQILTDTDPAGWAT